MRTNGHGLLVSLQKLVNRTGSEQRNVIVRADRAQVRAAADDKAASVFEAERDVVLELVEAVPGGWSRVRHRDGESGFVKASQVWGL